MKEGKLPNTSYKSSIILIPTNPFHISAKISNEILHIIQQYIKRSITHHNQVEFVSGMQR